jgi:hypothetical protein
MRYLNRALLLAALSLMLISCGDDDGDYLNDPPLEPPAITGASFTSADYILNTYHKSYFNPFFTEGDSYYYNHSYGITLLLKLNGPSYLDIIDRLSLKAMGGGDTLEFSFNKHRLHEMFSDTLGGFILTIDSIYIEGRDNYYPDKEYEWTAKLYDKDGNSGAVFTTQTKTNSYIYYDAVSSLLWNGGIKINFTGALSSISYREAKIFLFDSQKKYVKDYPYLEIDPDYCELIFNDIPANAEFFRVLIRDVYNGVKRTYIGKFETMPERL